jgi:hypothetical protein
LAGLYPLQATRFLVLFPLLILQFQAQKTAKGLLQATTQEQALAAFFPSLDDKQ